MSALTINIPDAIEPRLISGACKALGYDGIDSPTQRKQFVKLQAIAWLKAISAQGEIAAAAETVRADKTIKDAVIT